MVLLIGAQAHRALWGRLAPDSVEAAPLQGHALSAAPLAGIAAGAWPALRAGLGAGPGGIAVRETGWTPELRRYADIFGLAPVTIDGREVLGLQAEPPADAGTWQPDLAGAMAAWVLDLPADLPAASIRQRLPMIAAWVSARLRAAQDSENLPQIGPKGDERLQIISRDEPYAKFFSVEEIALRHRRYDGGWSPALDREVFISADAVLLLPYDPVADTVLLISQFRVGPMARGQAQCWMLEPIAGRVDAGESPADAARREAVEEAGLAVGRLYPLPPHYPTPGANSEFFYPFIAAVDLSGRTAGQGFGLASEGEDIATHIIARTELMGLAETGQMQCGPLLGMALMLDRMAPQIRADLAGT